MTAVTLPDDAVSAMAGTAACALAWEMLGRLHVTAVAKATFAFADEAVMPRIEPQKILTAEVHHGKNPARSVRFTSDVAPHLARADVLFTGFAHALPGGPVRSLPVRLAIRSGDRLLVDKRLLAQDASGFQRLSLTYEHAWGGVDHPDNPLGVGAVPGTGEPNVVDPANPRTPAGFGPIGRLWPARKRLLGATSRKDLEGPLARIPDGFDWSYFQAAPPDQRIDYLHGDEWVVLEGLHPTLGRTRMHLPRAQGFARVHGLGGHGVPEGQVLPLVADTLRIDGEQMRCTLVFRASFTVPDLAALDAVRIAAGVESWGAPVVWRTPPPRSAPRPSRPPGAAAPPPPEPSGGDLFDGDPTLARGPARDSTAPPPVLAAGGTLMMGSPPTLGGMGPKR